MNGAGDISLASATRGEGPLLGLLCDEASFPGSRPGTMTIGVAAAHDGNVDVGPLLSGALTPVEWINSCVEEDSGPQPPNPAYCSQLLARFDALAWKLEQATLKKSVEFENAWRRYTVTLPAINAKIRDLRLGRHDRRLAEVGERLEAVDLQVAKLREFMDRTEVSRVRELLRTKHHLLSVVERTKLELQWLEMVHAMEAAMEKGDLDEAESSLRRLDDLVEAQWRTDVHKTEQVRGLRQKLVDIIRGCD